MGRSKFGASVLAAIVAFALSANPADAQVTIHGEAGVGVPTGDLSDGGLESGFAFGAGLGVQLGDRVEVRGTFDLYSLGFDDTLTGGFDVDVDILTLLLGLHFDLTDPSSPFYVGLNGGAGLMSFSPEDIDSTSKFAVAGGAEVGYWFSPSVAIYGTSGAQIGFFDETDDGIGSAVIIPLQGGIKIRLGN